MYLVDTNVVSETRKVGSGKANSGVALWSNDVNNQDLFISVITLLEIQQGILSLQRKDTKQAKRLKMWLNHDLIPSFTQCILDVDKKIALLCASLHVPDKKPANDALIAATAMVHGLTLVTRNTADFENLNIS